MLLLPNPFQSLADDLAAIGLGGVGTVHRNLSPAEARAIIRRYGYEVR